LHCQVNPVLFIFVFFFRFGAESRNAHFENLNKKLSVKDIKENVYKISKKTSPREAESELMFNSIDIVQDDSHYSQEFDENFVLLQNMNKNDKLKNGQSCGSVRNGGNNDANSKINFPLLNNMKPQKEITNLMKREESKRYLERKGTDKHFEREELIESANSSPSNPGINDPIENTFCFRDNSKSENARGEGKNIEIIGTNCNEKDKNNNMIHIPSYPNLLILADDFKKDCEKDHDHYPISSPEREIHCFPQREPISTGALNLNEIGTLSEITPFASPLPLENEEEYNNKNNNLLNECHFRFSLFS